MKSVLISIQPKWCELIASGKKTVEVRKTKPKIDVPFKCYIYCTQNTPYNPVVPMKYEKEDGNIYTGGKRYAEFLTGKVIGEFLCDNILYYTLDPYGHHSYFISDDDFENTCLTFFEELWNYGKGKTLYGWHISDLVIYDKPKELSEFIVPSNVGCCNEGNCRGCRWFDRGNGFNVEDDCNAPFCTDEYKPLRKATQSWCYVEEVRK